MIREIYLSPRSFSREIELAKHGGAMLNIDAVVRT
jgi:hypothetical protein